MHIDHNFLSKDLIILTYGRMQRLIEETLLRNKIYIFKDRQEAGTLLAQRLLGYKDSDGIVFTNGIIYSRYVSFSYQAGMYWSVHTIQFVYVN